MTPKEKHTKLKNYIKELGSVAIAFSGGIDSTFLLKTAYELLGDNTIAITAYSPSFPERELKEAVDFCKKEGIKHIICKTNELSLDEFAANTPNRCYICKKVIFSSIIAMAKSRGIMNVAEGSNVDDNGDYRPGRRAIAELGIISPLCYAGLGKDEIRLLSKELGLSQWNKLSFACLATRFPYGEGITAERLYMVDRAEQLLIDLGFSRVRVRFHGKLARIETDEEGFLLLAKSDLRRKIHTELKSIGFTYVSIDLLGYRTGSMNEALDLNAGK